MNFLADLWLLCRISQQQRASVPVAIHSIQPQFPALPLLLLLIFPFCHDLLEELLVQLFILFNHVNVILDLHLRRLFLTAKSKISFAHHLSPALVALHAFRSVSKPRVLYIQ